PSGEAYNRSLTNSGCSAEINGLDGTVQICNSRSSNLDQGTTANEIVIIVYDKIATKPPKLGTWRINLTGDTISGTGEVDFWMTSRLGTDSSKVASFTTLVDTSETLGIPGTSRQAITVGAHVTRVCWEDSNGNTQSYASPPFLGDIAPFSSFGPTRDGRAKPEISAPGMGIVAPLADEVRNAVINAGYGALVVTDDYLLLQGTSMAAPHVTGAVALLLQADPAATNATLRSRLASSARDDAFTREHDTGISLFASNYSFGAGKLDLGDWAYADPYETNDTPSQAYAVLSGQPLSGYIERPDDVDYFQLQGALGGDTMDVKLTSLPQDYALALQNRSLSLDVCVPGSMSTKASSNNPGTADESILYTLQTGFVGPASWIRVTSPTGAVHSSDSYQVRALLTRPETTGTHNSVATSQPLPDFREMKVTGAIASGVADFYSFKIQTGSTIVLSAAGRIVSVRNSAGTTVASGFNTVSYTVPGVFLGPTTHHAVVSGGLNATYTLNLKIQ
ncbi:MAG TPA: S8 family serine peptidase, partial [Thermoanaerobaculia bacterium]|nr:S8 family serine peptidase [Thermoanaerobaculia bacterium]